MLISQLGTGLQSTDSYWLLSIYLSLPTCWLWFCCELDINLFGFRWNYTETIIFILHSSGESMSKLIWVLPHHHCVCVSTVHVLYMYMYTKYFQEFCENNHRHITQVGFEPTALAMLEQYWVYSANTRCYLYITRMWNWDTLFYPSFTI